MKFKSEELLSDLIQQTKGILTFADSLKSLPYTSPNRRLHKDSWSVLECLEHLNRYGDYYLKEISTRLNQSKVKGAEIFKSGFLGNYFAQSMLPKKKLNKMKTFKAMNPIHTALDSSVLNTFIEQQHKMLALLEKAKSKNLNKIKTGISISKLIKIKLGDTFRFVIYHNLRHIEQIKNILMSTKADKPAGSVKEEVQTH